MSTYDITQHGHIVNILPPVEANAAGAQVSDYFSMKNYDTCIILLTLGVTGAATTVTVEESDDNAGNDANAIAFDYRTEDTAAGDTFDAGYTTVTNTGFATSTNDSIMYAIRIKSSQLTDGYPYLVLKLTDPASDTWTSAVAILTNSRYSQDVTVSAIT